MKKIFYNVSIISLSLGIVISNSKENYISYSFSYASDNYNYINESEEEVSLRAGLVNSYFSYIINNKYYLSFNYKYNNNLLNDFKMPYKGSYGYISFSYHIKERQKFPLNMSFGFSRGFSFKNDYVANNYDLQLYKNFESNFYPLTLSYLISKNESKLIDYSHTLSKISLYFKLSVDMNDNAPITDVIFIGFSISNINKDFFGSINIGISHSLK